MKRNYTKQGTKSNCLAPRRTSQDNDVPIFLTNQSLLPCCPRLMSRISLQEQYDHSLSRYRKCPSFEEFEWFQESIEDSTFLLAKSVKDLRYGFQSLMNSKRRKESGSMRSDFYEIQWLRGYLDFRHHPAPGQAGCRLKNTKKSDENP